MNHGEGEKNMQENFVLTTAVAFCVFKSLDTTKQVFERIREAKPPKLYIVADAARGHVPGEKEKDRKRTRLNSSH